MWPVWSRDSKIDCISRMKRLNELHFCMLVQIYEGLDFCEFRHDARNPYEVPERAGYFGETFSAPIGEIIQK